MMPGDTRARNRAYMPEGTEKVLSARTLSDSHKRLDELLNPGMAVLDVGCGNGAITRGIVDRVQPGGRVVGVDINERLIQEAEARWGGNSGLLFQTGDIYDLEYDSEFDIVTSARVLQWLANPKSALQSMVKAAVSGGKVVVLDYNHERLVWKPEPPASVRRFYQAFLDWRSDAGMDNAIADHLESMFLEVGLSDVLVTSQHEETNRGDADFEQRIGIWASVMAVRGKQMVADGALTEDERVTAEREYWEWIRDTAKSQRMYLLAVEGVK